MSKVRLDIVKLLRSRPKRGKSAMPFKEILNITYGDRGRK